MRGGGFQQAGPGERQGDGALRYQRQHFTAREAADCSSQRTSAWSQQYTCRKQFRVYREATAAHKAERRVAGRPEGATVQRNRQLELEARFQFQHASGVGGERLAEGRIADVGVGGAELERLQVQHVEHVVSVHAELHQRSLRQAHGVQTEAFSDAHVNLLEAGTAEAVASHRRNSRLSVVVERAAAGEVGSRSGKRAVGVAVDGRLQNAARPVRAQALAGHRQAVLVGDRRPRQAGVIGEDAAQLEAAQHRAQQVFAAGERQPPDAGEVEEMSGVEVRRAVFELLVLRIGLVGDEPGTAVGQRIQALAPAVIGGELHAIGEIARQPQVQRIEVAGHVWLDKIRRVDRRIHRSVNVV